MPPRNPADRPATEPHDPDCLLLDKNHDGPHMVRPDHPKVHSPQTYECSKCDYVMWDAALGDVEDHWRDAHRAEGLDVERLAEALASAGWDSHPVEIVRFAGVVEREYARLSRPSDEVTP